VGARLTTEQWIANARRVWGEIYDYAAVKYVDSRTPVEVRCPHHGAWFTLPTNHAKANNPRGCPECGRAKQIKAAQKPFAQFVTEAAAAHGGRYSYDATTYDGANQPTRILCGHHGEFWQRPSSHAGHGNGCPSCAQVRSSSQSNAHYGTVVDARVRARSGGKVTLNVNTYAGINRKAEFVCSEHGPFRRLVNRVLHGTPCLACGDPINQSNAQRRHVAEETLLAQIACRWPEYELQPFDYHGPKTRVSLSCPKHSSFEVAAGSITRSPGCPCCARQRSQESRTLGLRKKNAATLQRRSDDWLQKARAVHGEAYDYSRVRYSSAREEVEIGCQRHGGSTAALSYLPFVLT